MYVGGFISMLIWPLLIIGLIAGFIIRRSIRSHASRDKEWYMQLALSKEDVFSQLFLLFSLLFLGITLISINKDLNGPLSWQMILFITSFIGLVGSYYLKTIYTLIFSLIGLVSWWAAQAAEWSIGKNIKISALFTGLTFIALIFYVLGRIHEQNPKFKRCALVYTVLGIISVTGSLFFFSTKIGVGAIGEMTKGTLFLDSWQLTFSLFIFLIALLGTAFYAIARKTLSPFEGAAILILMCLFGVTALLNEQIMYMQIKTTDFYYGGRALSIRGIVWAIIYNAAVFFELLGLIFLGHIRREVWLINLGALFLSLLIIVKYFDWFFTFLDKSIFFIGAGILLFAVGWFMERGRKYMISKLTEEIPQ